MTRVLFLAPLLAAIAFPAAAQEHHDHGAPPPSPPAAQGLTPTQPSAAPKVVRPLDLQSPVTAQTGADLVVGNDSPPDVANDHAADRYYAADSMAASRAILDNEHGGTLNSMAFARIAEYQFRKGENGYRWDGAAWYGGDINRFVLKTEGEGGVDSGVGGAEVQALYSRAVGPYTDLQVGLRQDIEPRARSYASVGVEALLPYWFDAGAALFLSDHGHVRGRVEGDYALRLTQRLVLEPRIELNFAASEDRAAGIGAGLTDGELGLRLRYEFRREFAPYIGVVHERKFGSTADLVRATGEDVESTSFVLGLRAWY